jgi:hypothetical protein
VLRLSAIEISTKIGLKLEKEFEFFVPSKMKKIIVGNPSQKKLGTDAFLLSFLLSSRSLHTRVVFQCFLSCTFLSQLSENNADFVKSILSIS